MSSADEWAARRDEMIVQIERLASRVAEESGRPTISPRVLAAMREVPRHRFVPESERATAYKDRPLPIGSGQTISQPFIVALMTDVLDVSPPHRVLEVGTGSGYQAAVLARLVAEVYTIEIVSALGRTAQATFESLGIGNVQTRIGDGYAGWREAAPFDRIIVTAAPDHVPPALVEQLKPGGLLVIPVGGLTQDLMVIEKKDDGSTVSREVIPVRFVPLTRGEIRVE